MAKRKTLGGFEGSTREIEVEVPDGEPEIWGADAKLRVVGTGQVQQDRVHATAAGPGDLFLRAKYRFARGRWGDLAAGLVLRLPTGDQDDFQGTGAVEVGPMLYASTARLPLGSILGLTGYLNAGLDLNAEEVDRSEGRFGLGADLHVGPRVTLATAVLGREPFSGIAPAVFFDVARVDPATGARSMGPILGLQTDRANTYDLSVGGRVVLWRDTVIGFVNVLLPLGDAGFRSDVIPLAGVEASF